MFHQKSFHRLKYAFTVVIVDVVVVVVVAFVMMVVVVVLVVVAVVMVGKFYCQNCISLIQTSWLDVRTDCTTDQWKNRLTHQKNWWSHLLVITVTVFELVFRCVLAFLKEVLSIGRSVFWSVCLFVVRPLSEFSNITLD